MTKISGRQSLAPAPDAGKSRRAPQNPTLQGTALELTTRIISCEDPLYEQERQLRNEVLLRPIGMPDGSWEMHDGESTHLVLLEGTSLVGVVLLRRVGPNRGKLSQMAIASSRQRQGLGTFLLEAVLREARAQGFDELSCHARDDAIPFYERVGFQISGAPFEEVGIGHHPMSLSLER